ncbi:hypothetical protein [Chelativorans sp. Marseille-P2723]|uniref:hypothetical protein n=1 Tax=Chelativorans sp. Marseille-P2723 TaxID=2709133 RepID=UPI00156F17A7|nr:hypothetical protein [Chelativorans sp. Marseille-P2723]
MTSKRGFFRNAVKALIEARERQAQRYVNRALQMLDKETLEARGIKRKDASNGE